MSRQTGTGNADDTSNDIFISIGQGTSIWALMEGNLVHIFADLMGISVEKAGLVLYSIINFNVRPTIITDPFASDPDFKVLRHVWNKKAERLKSLNNSRVRLAHQTVFEAGS